MKFFTYNTSLILALALVTAFASCKKDPEEPDPDTGTQTGTIGMHFENVFITNDGTETDLEISSTSGTTSPDGKPKYQTANGDSITVTAVRYWVSNISLIRADGSEYAVPDSYFLIQRGDSFIDEKFDLTSVPNGSYSGMKFYIGVDSAANGYVSGGKGELSAGVGMNWDWHEGYIFSKTEGQYKKADETWDSYAYHIGKLGNSLYKPDSPIVLTFSENVPVNSDHPRIHLKANVNAIFGLAGTTGSTVLDVKTLNMVHGTPDQDQIADNWRTNMFAYDHFHAH